jgi:Co/Zn/Cd efflux system component
MHESIQEIKFPTNDGSVNVFFLYGFASFNLIIDVASGYMFLRKGKNFAYTEQIEQEKVENGIIPDCNIIESGTNNKIEQPPLILQKTVKINMLAAFSHLGADSLRTASIFLAAVVASATDIDSDLCDAWAAIIVSATIFVMAVPLINYIIKSALKLHRENQQV